MDHGDPGDTRQSQILVTQIKLQLQLIQWLEEVLDTGSSGDTDKVTDSSVWLEGDSHCQAVL